MVVSIRQAHGNHVIALTICGKLPGRGIGLHAGIDLPGVIQSHKYTDGKADQSDDKTCAQTLHMIYDPGVGAGVGPAKACMGGV